MTVRDIVYLLSIACVWLSACTAGNAEIGEACEEMESCRSELCLLNDFRGEGTGWQDGYCSEHCNDDSSCPVRNKCYAIGQDQFCLAECASQSDCRSGYVCNPDWLVCLPNCHNEGWECRETLNCQTAGYCAEEIEGQGDGGIGAPCSSAGFCSTQYCIHPEDLNGNESYWKDGYCSLICPQGEGCPEGTTCQYFADGPYCMQDCQGDSGCRRGYICDTDWFACLPDCRLGWSCRPDQVCDAEGVCKDDEPLPPSCDQSQPPCCGDNVCNDNENSDNCSEDCPREEDGDIVSDGDETPDGDAQPDGDEPIDPAACETAEDCKKELACPPEASLGCDCILTPQNTKACVPKCEKDEDCPFAPGQQLVCNTQAGICVPEA